MVVCQIRLHDVQVGFCRQARLATRVESGHSLTTGLDGTHPADFLVMDWKLSKPAAFNVLSPLLLWPKLVWILVLLPL